MYFLTIDFGTTNFKIILWNEEGKIEKKKIFSTPLSSENSIDPKKPIEFIETFFRNLERKYKNSIKGMAVGGMGEAGLLIDKKGKPLTPIFSWLDERGKEELKILEKEKIFYITGLKLLSKYSLGKILWIKGQKENLWKEGYKWLNAIDFINFYLTGEIITDYTLASRMLLFDLKNKDWSEEILALTKIPREKLPKIKPLGSIMGEIRKDLAKNFSLPSFPVILGGHDHPVGSLALDLKDSLLDSWGTAEAFLIHTKEPLLREEIRNLGFSVGCIKENLYYLIAGIHFSGGIRKWIKENMGWKIKIKNKPSKIFFFPYILGKSLHQRDITLKGFFYGIDLNTTIDDLKRAVWEGVFYESKCIIEDFKNLGVNMEKIILTGGMGRFKSLLKLKTNILNMPLYVTLEKELTSKGLAKIIVESMAPEIKEKFQEKSFEIIIPENKREYEERFKEYKKIRDLLGI